MRTSKNHFHKLVRDKIPQIIEGGGKKVKFSKLVKHDRREALRNKLNEEVDELLASKTPEEILEEIVDVHEVLMAMVYDAGFIDADMFLLAKQKKREKGAFEDFVWLESVEDI